MEKKTTSILIGNGKKIIFETGKIARQAHGAVVASCEDTIVFSTACMASEVSSEISFFPFRVDYQEKFFSAGKTLGGFIKREGRPTEKEILISRLIDRSLRPIMPEGFFNETQVLSYVWSYDGVNLPDPLAICASSAALIISKIPITKPVAGVRIGKIGSQLIVNPTVEEMKNSSLDLILSGTEDAILMIEGHCSFLTEEEILQAIDFGHQSIKSICQTLSSWQKEIGVSKDFSCIQSFPKEVFEAIKLKSSQIDSILDISNKNERDNQLTNLEAMLIEEFQEKSLLDSNSPFTPFNIKMAFKQVKSEIMRSKVLLTKKRLDGRTLEEVRCIDIETNLLPRAHGSCLFTRGETQTMAVCTLGGENMGQRFEDLNGEGLRRFYLQYFFPPFCVGEVGRIGSPGRREVGHGKLAEKALAYTLPEFENFPYSIRLESNITESNGSSSMASICGGCLALMDAGVPIKTPIAGIAMGLILEKDQFVILSDIMGVEDHLGDMDFKVAGNKDGITAFQMDIKVEGITLDIMRHALHQAKQGKNHILNKMYSALPEAKQNLSEYAPRIETMQVKQNKLATIIGPGGKQIRQIIDETGVQIDINDSGLVSISSSNKEAMEKAKAIIESLVGEVEIGKIYKGKVTSVVNFGAFIEILPGKEGLCHISELSLSRVEDIHEHIKKGDKIDVKVLGINEKGQIKLSHKILKQSE